MGKNSEDSNGFGRRLANSVREGVARTLRSAADKLEGPRATFELANIAIDFQFDIAHETVWATQKQMADLFGVDQSAIAKHIQNIFATNELADDSATHAKMALVQNEGGRQVERLVSHFSLDMIMTVGYRLSGSRAAAFRKWANGVLRKYVIDGYALNERRLRSDPEALQSLADRVRALRLEEKSLYAIVRDCFVISSSDYDKDAEESRRFFQTMQEKFNYAASEHTSAELILERADHTKPQMGMSTCPSGKPTLKDAQIGKNYLLEDELKLLRLVSEAFLLYAEGKAMRNKKMTMTELLAKLDKILEFNEMPVFPGYKSWNTRDRANLHAKRQLELFNAKATSDRYQQARGLNR